MSTNHIKESLPLYHNTNPSLLTAIGFGAGSLPSLLLLLGPAIIIPGIISGGALGGLALAYAGQRRSVTLRTMFAFGTAFLIGGSFSGLGIFVEQISTAPGSSFASFEFYLLYISGFVISGVLSALLTRSQFISVKNSAIAFVIAGTVGGVVIDVLNKVIWPKNALIYVIGLFITNVIGGAFCGAVLESTPAEPQSIRQE